MFLFSVFWGHLSVYYEQAYSPVWLKYSSFSQNSCLLTQPSEKKALPLLGFPFTNTVTDRLHMSQSCTQSWSNAKMMGQKTKRSDCKYKLKYKAYTMHVSDCIIKTDARNYSRAGGRFIGNNALILFIRWFTGKLKCWVSVTFIRKKSDETCMAKL